MNAFLFTLFLIALSPQAGKSLALDEPTTDDSQVAARGSELTPDARILAPDLPVSCGVGTAYLLLQRLGETRTLEEIEAASPVRSDGPMTLEDLQQLFANLGFTAEGYRMPLERLEGPVIAYRPHPKGKLLSPGAPGVGHFFVVEPVGNQRSEVGGQTSGVEEFLVIDPLDQPVKVPFERLAGAWDGRVLVGYPERAKASGRIGQSLIPWFPTMAAVACAALVLAVSFFLVRRHIGSSSLFTDSLANAIGSTQTHQRSGTGTRLSMPVVLASAFGCLAIAAGVYRASGLLFSRSGIASTPDTPTENNSVIIPVPDWQTSIRLYDGISFDFGQVKLGETLSHTFAVKNVGEHDLPLATLKMNCACNAQVEYERDVCLPGETAGIQISTKAVGYGPQRKPIPFAISRDGTLRTLLTLDLHYRVSWLEQAQFVPSRLELGEISSTAGVDREVELVLIGPPDGSTPETTEVESDSPALRAEVVRREPVPVNARTARTIPAQRVVYAIRILVDPQQLPIGKLHGHVTAQTSTGEAKLHVTGAICHPVIASPASLLVQKSRATQTRHVIRLRRPGELTSHVEHDAEKRRQAVALQRPWEPIVLVSASTTTPGVACVVDSERNQVEVLIEAGAELSAGVGVSILAQAGEARETLFVPLVEF